GSRYLLPVAPLFVLGAVTWVRERPRWLAAPAAALALLSVAATVTNLRAEARLRGENAELLAAVRRTDTPDLVTNFFWIPQVLAPLYLARRFYWTGHAGEDALCEKLVRHDISKRTRRLGGSQPHRTSEGIVNQDAVLLPPDCVVVYTLASGAEP